MADLPEYLARGERARLFPVLADTSKEGRSTSILLACLASVREFNQSMLSSVGQRIGKRTAVAAFTEVAFAAERDKKAHRPDGLIVLRVGNREWRAFIETKVGNNELNEEQIAAYLDLAKTHGIDAVIMPRGITPPRARMEKPPPEGEGQCGSSSFLLRT